MHRDSAVLNAFLTDSDSDDLEMLLEAMEDEEVERERQRKHRRGSVPGRRVIHRNRVEGHNRLYRDYFADNPVYHDVYFRRRFRMNMLLQMLHHHMNIQMSLRSLFKLITKSGIVLLIPDSSMILLSICGICTVKNSIVCLLQPMFLLCMLFLFYFIISLNYVSGTMLFCMYHFIKMLVPFIIY
ncbi:hypothetical protein ABFS83_05G131300 [Erythranthe nasuta]